MNYSRMERAGDWWERRWFRFHATLAPFGVLAATLLLTYLAEGGRWAGRESWDLTATMVDLGAVSYAALAVIAEQGVRLMLWALDKRREWRERWQAEAMDAGFAEGNAQGHAKGLVEGRTEGRARERRRNEEWLKKVSEETGIPLSKLLPPEDEESE